MSYYDFKTEWDEKPALLEQLPLYALRGWRNVMRNPVYDAVSWQTDREPFDEIMDSCDTGNFPREFKKWWDTIVGDMGDGHTGPVYMDRLLQLTRYKSVVHAIACVERREIAELLAVKAA